MVAYPTPTLKNSVPDDAEVKSFGIVRRLRALPSTALLANFQVLLNLGMNFVVGPTAPQQNSSPNLAMQIFMPNQLRYVSYEGSDVTDLSFGQVA